MTSSRASTADLIGKYINIASRAPASLPSALAASFCPATKTAQWPPRSGQAGARCWRAHTGRLRSAEFGKVVRRVMELADRMNAGYRSGKASGAGQGSSAGASAVGSVLGLHRCIPQAHGAAGSDSSRHCRASCKDAGITCRCAGRSCASRSLSRCNPMSTSCNVWIQNSWTPCSLPCRGDSVTFQLGPASTPASSEGVISIDEFNRIDLRVARIVAAEPIDGADKLLKLTLDVGNGMRTVYAGINPHIRPRASRVDRSWWLPTSRRARCASALRKAWCWRQVTAPASFCCLPDQGAQPGMKVK